ncbi:hypothetical protein HPB52_024545 [Rhipicephalus sanguineus]|uniref:Uncharacterized protein n=1 Tax=Rhipicephalus sanguineus TaxID=34632 RepID=A0A9D4PAK0_RHISA|nr:hypothetical protein HPB52_024545 [Rhipicephalus sanguineus]
MDECSCHGGLIVDELKLSEHLSAGLRPGSDSGEHDAPRLFTLTESGRVDHTDRRTKADHIAVLGFAPPVPGSCPQRSPWRLTAAVPDEALSKELPWFRSCALHDAVPAVTPGVIPGDDCRARMLPGIYLLGRATPRF